MRYWSNFFCGVGMTCFAAVIIKPDIWGGFAAFVAAYLGFLFDRIANLEERP